MVVCGLNFVNWDSNSIQTDVLRMRVTANLCYNAAMLTIDEVRPLYQNDAAHDLDHVLRVLANAERIGQAEGADMAIVRTATLLHDIARVDQSHTGRDHAIVGAAWAGELLTKRGCEAAFVEAVTHAIAAHRFRVERPPQTLEAKILYDADKLDSIGAIGMARAFTYGGHLGRRLWVEDEIEAGSTRQEFQRKLVKIKDKLFTETARHIAQQRHEFMLMFVEQISAEVQGTR